MNVHVLGESVLKRYIVVGHKAGQWRPLMKYFPICESENEAMQHVFAKSLADPAWREHYKGWSFCAASWSNSVKINEDGTVGRCK